MIGKTWWIVAAMVATLSLSGCCFCCPPGENASLRVARDLGGGPLQRETRQVSLQDADEVKVVLEFGGGELDIERGSAELMEGEFLYNQDGLEPRIVYDSSGQQGRLEIRHQSDVIPWDLLSSEIRNEWQLQFTDRVPLDLSADVGASIGRLDLGGLLLKDLDLTAGAADMSVSFGEPNPERLESLRVHSGAARLELLELGNANLDELTFDGGLGTYSFDFGGEWKRSARAHIQAGASQVFLRVPRDIGVRVCAGDLRRADYGGLKEQDGCYVNDLYGASDLTLEVSLDLGLGRLDIRQTN
jgi:hypothetical protein